MVSAPNSKVVNALVFSTAKFKALTAFAANALEAICFPLVLATKTEANAAILQRESALNVNQSS